jgi:hypothetical protein
MFGNAQQNVRSVSPPRVLRASLSGPHAHALQVRLHAVKLLCVCAQQQPQQLHATRRRGTASTRADAAFSRLCSVACDPTPAVRVEARTHPSPPLEPCTCTLDSTTRLETLLKSLLESKLRNPLNSGRSPTQSRG